MKKMGEEGEKGNEGGGRERDKFIDNQIDD
jgi:hypothetical protein